MSTDIETWFVARGGWVLIAMCAIALFFALAVFAMTNEPDDEDRTAPPVDLDTELRRLIEDEQKRNQP